MKTQDRRYAMLDSNPVLLFLHYLLPGLCANMVIAANYFIDTICVGMKIGETGLAALNVAVPVTGLLYAVGFMFAFGASNLFSNRMGENKPEEAKTYYGTALAAVTIIVVLVTGLGLTFNRQICTVLCAGAAFQPLTEEYMWYVFVCAAFYCYEAFFSVFVRNDGEPVFSMIGTISDCVLNVVLDILFVWVLDMGMAGASLATGLALIVGAGVSFSGTLRKKSQIKFWECKVRFRVLWEIVVNGMPDFLREISGSLVILVANVLLLKLSGDTAVAAYSVIANLATVVLCALGGVSNAVQPLISFCIGAGHRDRVHKMLKMSVIASLIISSAYLLLAELKPEWLVAVFLDDPDPMLSEMCRVGIRIISPGYILAGLSTILNTYAEAVHAPHDAFWMATTRGMIAPIACIVICVSMGGVNGLWAAMILTEIVSYLAIYAIFCNVKRKLKTGKISFQPT